MITDSLDVNKWIRFAQMDFDSASTLTKTRFRPPIEVVCYLCQQTAEKILKAYTIAKKNSRTKTHVLDDLLDECIPYSADFNNLRNNCAKLMPYIALAHYPVDIELAEHHMRQAIKDAQIILEFTKSKLQELGFVPETEPTQN